MINMYSTLYVTEGIPDITLFDAKAWDISAHVQNVIRNPYSADFITLVGLWGKIFALSKKKKLSSCCCILFSWVAPLFMLT